MVSGRSELPLCFCEGSYHTVCAAHQRRMRKLGRPSAVRVGKEPPFRVLAASGDLFQAGPARTDASTAATCATDTHRYQVHTAKEDYSLLDGIHYLPGFKSGFVAPPTFNQVGLVRVMSAVCGGYSAVEEVSTENSAAPTRSEQPEFRSLAALSQQTTRIRRTKRPAHSFRNKQNCRKSIHGFSY